MNWLANYFRGKRTSHPASRRPRTFQPTFELLETRDCPSAAAALPNAWHEVVNTISPTAHAQVALPANSFTPTTGSSGNWSGYEATPGSGQLVNQISGTWAEPSYTNASTTSANSIWVGISGSGGHGDIEQAGVAWYGSSFNNPGYQAWVECLHDKTQNASGKWTGDQIPVQLTTSSGSLFYIQSGDTVTTSVQLVSGTTDEFQFTIAATGSNGTGSFSQVYTTESAPTSMASAEWIVENPNGSAQSLANFGTVDFSNCSAQVGSGQGAINAFPCQLWNMADSAGNASPSSLGNTGNSFSVSYGSNPSTSDNSAVLVTAQAANVELPDLLILNAGSDHFSITIDNSVKAVLPTEQAAGSGLPSFSALDAVFAQHSQDGNSAFDAAFAQQAQDANQSNLVLLDAAFAQYYLDTKLV